MVSQQDFEQLSAYIDDELTQPERTILEQRLQAEPDLRRELDELRVLVAAVRALPAVRPPRDFLLTPEMVARRNLPHFLLFPATRVVSAIASAAALILIMFGGLLLLAGPNTQTGAPTGDLGAVAVQPTTVASEVVTLSAASDAPLPSPEVLEEAADDMADGTMSTGQSPAFLSDDEEGEGAIAEGPSNNEAAAELFDADVPPPSVSRALPVPEATLTVMPSPTVAPTPQATATESEPPPADSRPPTITTEMWAAVLFGLGAVALLIGVGTFVRRRNTRGNT